jgi:hypothetical protein
MGSRPAKKDLAERSGPKTLQQKLQIEKTAIETNYALKPGFSRFFFRQRFFSNVNLSLQNTSLYIYLPMVQYMELEVILYPWVYQVLII